MNREKLIEVCALTPEQEKAFNKLKKAYKECEKKGIFFVNIYGSLSAFDSDLVQDYGDYIIRPEGVYEIELGGASYAEYLTIPDQFSDDNHILGLTKKGMDLYLSEED